MHNSSLPVIIRYAIVTLMSALVTRGLVTPESGAFLSQNVDTVVGAVIALGTVLYGLWRTPTARGLEVARKVDAQVPAESPVVIKTPPGVDDIIVSGDK